MDWYRVLRATDRDCDDPQDPRACIAVRLTGSVRMDVYDGTTGPVLQTDVTCALMPADIVVHGRRLEYGLRGSRSAC